MKKVLLDENLNFYRANLHCHTTISDGKKTPEEVKNFYKRRGYSVVAYTDHDVFIPHNDLTDDKFIALNAMEINPTGDKPYGARVDLCHFCLIAKDKNNKTDPFYRRWPYTRECIPQWGDISEWFDRVDTDMTAPDYPMSYDPDVISNIMKEAHEKGFFVTYNHPSWSREFYPQYSKYSGMDAMEISNYGCVLEGYDEDNGHCYDDFLLQGKKIYAIATDDNHNWHSDDDPKSDSFGGATVINAPELTYEAIISALEKGNFYSTTGTPEHDGPEIKSIVWEDGSLTIKTSPVRAIYLITATRAARSIFTNHGKLTSGVTFRPDKGEDWFRFMIVDDMGYKAFSNAYFPADLEK